MSITLFAHKLNLFLDIENNNLYIYSYFATGSPCKNCKIELFDLNNKLIQKLQTDEKGEYYLKDFSKVKYVKVEALGGHGAKKELNFHNKEKKEQKPENSYLQSLLQSLISFILIIGIFLFLKRIKK